MAKATMGFLLLMVSVTLKANTGEACLSDQSCDFGEHCMTEFDQGYCTQFDCESDMDCGAGSRCLLVEPDHFSVCLKSCEQSSDCRLGYSCSSQGICL